MTAGVLGALTWVLRLGAVAWTLGLLVVLVGAFVPRTPVVGFLGSFVTGQYPVHAALAALVGLGLGAGTAATGARGTGWVLGGVALATFVGLVVVLGAQWRTARAEGVALDPLLSLSAPTQAGAPGPDLTVRYSADPALDLDLFRPPGPGPHPVMVWVHGGSWVRGERTDRARTNRWLADRGVAVVAVTYRLPPPTPVGEGQRRDVATALGWVADHAAEQGLDPASVTLGGQSAGATLALSTASALAAGVPTAGPLRDGRPVPAPRAVAAFYPVIDMRAIAPGLQDAVFGGPAASFPDRLAAASPSDQVRAGLPPTLVVLGSADHFVFADRVRAYEAELRRVGVPGRLLLVPYADHVFDYPFGSPGGQTARVVLERFVREYGAA